MRAPTIGVVVELGDAPDRAADAHRRRGEPEDPEDRRVAPHLPQQQQRAERRARGELEVGRQHQRRDDADQHRADGAAQRDHQVEARQVARRGLEARELAVAEHAGEEQPGAEHADLDLELVRELGVGERPRHHAERRGEHRQEDVAPVPAGGVEAEDEREQVERERHDPQQRHRRDVLRDVVRHREQQQRARWRRACTTGAAATASAAARRRRCARRSAASAGRCVTTAGVARGAGCASRPPRTARRTARSPPTSRSPASRVGAQGSSRNG